MKQQKYFNAEYDLALISNMSKELNLDSKVIELLFSRGISTKDDIIKFLNPTEKDFHDPYQLSGMREAVERIKEAIKNKEKIVIFGDYDVDGVSATAIMVKTFEKMNHHVDYYLPNRFTDDYGLTKEVIDKVKDNFSPSLIITVDCGICCAKEVDYAKSIGIDVIVTDHHEIPECIPNQVVVNVKLDNQEYPFKDLCGTGVALKISQALLGFKEAEEFLPIAAIATIADIVSLTDENRAIVALGMKLFDKYLPLGLKLLFKENKLNLKSVNSTEVSFKIAPKINSSGRMGEATDSLLLYLEKDINKIKLLLNKINEYNTRRQKICTDVFDDCVKKLKKFNIANERCIILSSKNWDAGILGIVCAKLVDAYNRPAFLFSEKDGVLKGSARSLNDINVHEMLTSMQDILVTFGGHKMAAGLTLNAEHLPIFIEKVNSFIFTKISTKIFTPIYFYDLDITTPELTDKFYNDLQKLEPFGLNNTKPLLKIKSEETRITPLKNYPTHYTITIGKALNLIYFNCSEKYFSLKYSKNKNFIFELQNKYNNQFKGIVKNFNGGFEFDKSFTSTLDAFVFEQLKYLKNKTKVTNKIYNDTELIKFVAECEANPFGTIFVSTSSQSYKNFTKKYSSDNIKDLFIFNNSSDSGANALYLYPTDLSIFKNYNNIVFLDPILDKTYLAEIRKFSNGTIYLPENSAFNKKPFENINLSRDAISNFFIKIKQLNNQNFSNILHLYNNFVRLLKISFNNFLIYFLILSELNIINFINNDQYTLQINSKDKNELNNSLIYTTIGYLSQFIKNNKK
ncbi:MAG: single-stranded-DNA-specific exonuclease RecJ [Clostridia bacterium]|nr:single-stranded-DNA-specific exonuclease RecJ [Clostridia bacterium]